MLHIFVVWAEIVTLKRDLYFYLALIVKYIVIYTRLLQQLVNMFIDKKVRVAYFASRRVDDFKTAHKRNKVSQGRKK